MNDKTLADHADHHAGKERTATTKPKCAATRTTAGRAHTCTKTAGHSGDHKAGTFTWRRSSGDQD